MVDTALLVFIAYLAVILAGTYYVTRKARSVDVEDFQTNFYVGGRNLGVLVTTLLVAAGLVSSGTFLGGPGYTWSYGPAFSIFTLGQGAINIYLLGIYGKKISVISRRINADSFLDLFKERFESYAPLMLTLVISIFIFLEAYLGSEFAGGARVIAALTPFSYLSSLLIFGGIIITYTTLGGLRGVGLIGIIQGIVITVATLTIFVASFTGVGNIFPRLMEIDPELVIPPGRGKTWLGFISIWILYSVGMLGLPHPIQGILGMDSTKTLRRSAALGVTLVTLWTLFLIFAGSAGKVLNPTGIIPDNGLLFMANTTLPGPLTGIVLAGIVGAAQTTIASMSILISSAAIVNFYQEYISTDTDESGSRLMIGATTAVVGIIGLLIGATKPPLLQDLVIIASGGLGASLAPSLLLGIFWPRANKYGAFIGAFSGLVSYIIFEMIDFGLIPNTSFILSFSLSFVLTAIVSYVTEPPNERTLRIYFGAEKESSEPSD